MIAVTANAKIGQDKIDNAIKLAERRRAKIKMTIPKTPIQNTIAAAIVY